MESRLTRQDREIAAARETWLHAVWSGDPVATKKALDALDQLLEGRLRLTAGTPR